MKIRRFISAMLALALCAAQSSVLAFDKAPYQTKLQELSELMKQCRDAGINTDYEQINYYTIQKFLPYLEDDSAANVSYQAYNEAQIEALYQEAKANLQGYLANTKTPKEGTYKYKTGDFNVQGKSLVTAEGRPVYSIGVGHGTFAEDDLYNLQNYGYSNIQIEAPIGSFVVESDNAKGYTVNSDRAYAIAKVLDRAESANISVSLLITTHTMPEFLMQKFPAMASTNAHFGYNLHNSKAREVIEDFLNALLPIVSEYDSLTNICSENEPGGRVCGQASFYNVYFRDYLAKKYKTISSLNGTYGSSYASFDAVEIPTSVSGAIAYDWMDCQEELFAEYIAFLKGIVSRYTSVPTHVKAFRSTCRIENSENKNTLFRGVGLEELKSVSGIAGTDQESYFRHGTGTGLQDTLMTYDYLSSIYEKPVYNSEDHLIDNGDSRYGSYQKNHVTGALWQSVMHGLSASTMWVWERSNSIAQFKNSILTRPDVVAAVGKTNYDLNRLAYQVNAFTEETPSVAILYSAATRIYETGSQAKYRHIDVLDKYYLGSLYSGEKVGFITEKTYGNLGDYKVLIIPQVKNITEGCLIAIRNFVTDGGKVIIYQNGINAISCDEHNNALDTYTINYIKQNSDIVSTYGGDSSDCYGNYSVASLLNTKFNSYIPNRRVAVLDSDGDPIFGVDWNTVNYKGTTLINLCNYARGDEEDEAGVISGVNIKINGTNISSAKNLITGQTLNAPFTLTEMQPLLLQVGTEEGGSQGSEETVLKPVRDLVYSTNVLKWKKGLGDTAYNGANIYRIDANGNEVLLGSTLYTSFEYQQPVEPTILRICAKNSLNQESDGVLCAIGMDSAEIAVLSSVCEEGKATLIVKNNNSYPVYRSFIAAIYNGNNLVSAGGKNCILLPGATEEIVVEAAGISNACLIKLL